MWLLLVPQGRQSFFLHIEHTEWSHILNNPAGDADMKFINVASFFGDKKLSYDELDHIVFQGV